MARKKANLTESKEISVNVTNSGKRPVRERLEARVLEELWSIWRADPRVPSIKSRHSWAISRNANPRLVDCWFLRRKTCAKKAGNPISDCAYDLPLQRVSIVPKRELSATSIKAGPEAFSDLPSDDTLVYPNDDDYLNDLDASSDTVFDEDAPIGSKRSETPAYKEVLQQFRLEYPKHSPTMRCASKDRRRDIESTSFLVCNQGLENQSDFTCMLCSSSPAQDVTRSDSHMMSSSVPCSRLDFSSAALSELSAIPFLFRTPLAVPLDGVTGCQNVDWLVFEEELQHGVIDGKLDFSFLDVPHLTSMELTD